GGAGEDQRAARRAFPSRADADKACDAEQHGPALQRSVRIYERLSPIERHCAAIECAGVVGSISACGDSELVSLRKTDVETSELPEAQPVPPAESPLSGRRQDSLGRCLRTAYSAHQSS